MNTFLFDLDGTLLPLEEQKFVKTYFDEMHKVFEDIIEKEIFVKYVWTATDFMRKNEEHKTNMEIFMNKFEELVGDEIDEYKNRFDDFYDRGFLEVEKAVSKNDYSVKCINMLRNKGYTVVLATNPLFPLKAIHHRINWAGLKETDFHHITSYETSHFCKPCVNYYEEILSCINKKPEECIMVGNDVQEDLVAGELGLETFLLENHIINRDEADINCTYRGKYEDLYRFVENLPAI
ncbi:HAD family hydrolase [Vallitalea guaymasensis]|uniref:HAD family hydrolase n=1 Tax=Vallitalea guaymasensis TaxID=1185412 RepID=UPI0027295F0E|nr:HAD family hydrolase [Vallitalea guaymasensis]